MFLLSWVLYFFFVYLVDNISVFNSYASMTVAFKSASLYLSLILITGICFLIDLGIYLQHHLFKGGLVSVLMEEKSKEGFMELGNNSAYERDYSLPSIIEDLLIKKQNMTNKENSNVKINKVNEKDLRKIDRVDRVVDFNQISEEKLILSNNIQISENRNANENFSADNRQAIDKTESNRAKLEKENLATTNYKFSENNNTNDVFKNHQYNKVENSHIDSLPSVSNNQNDEDYLDNSQSQNVIRVEQIYDKNNNYYSNRGLEKSIHSSQFNLHNVPNIDRLSERKKAEKGNI